MYIKEKALCPAFISKINSNCEKKLIVLTISNYKEEVWHYLAVKKLSPLLREITLKNNGDFYCLKTVFNFAEIYNMFFCFAEKTIIKSLQKIKITEKLEIIAIILVEIEVLHVVLYFKS